MGHTHTHTRRPPKPTRPNPLQRSPPQLEQRGLCPAKEGPRRLPVLPEKPAEDKESVGFQEKHSCLSASPLLISEHAQPASGGTRGCVQLRARVVDRASRGVEHTHGEATASWRFLGATVTQVMQLKGACIRNFSEATSYFCAAGINPL